MRRLGAVFFSEFDDRPGLGQLLHLVQVRGLDRVHGAVGLVQEGLRFREVLLARVLLGLDLGRRGKARFLDLVDDLLLLLGLEAALSTTMEQGAQGSPGKGDATFLTTEGR